MISRVALAGLVGASMLAGCTFLIPFDDVPAAIEGGSPAVFESSVGPDVTVADSNDHDVVDAGADVRDAIANPDACKGHGDGKYCGGNMIVWPPENKDDLITCKGQVVSNVRVCTSGVGCIRMLNGFPDQCDECATKADGIYCGRDMAGWDPKNADQRVRCQNRAEVGLLLCNAPGCGSNGAASACK